MKTHVKLSSVVLLSVVFSSPVTPTLLTDIDQFIQDGNQIEQRIKEMIEDPNQGMKEREFVAYSQHQHLRFNIWWRNFKYVIQDLKKKLWTDTMVMDDKYL